MNAVWQTYTAQGNVSWVIDTAAAMSGTQGMYITENNE